MSDQPDISPPEGAAGAPKPKRRRRVLVWSLIVVASVLLVFSLTANWVQRAVLDTDQVVDTTDEILADEDVQEALSIYLVDQVYASVDVQGEIEAKLPKEAKALSAPVAAATRQIALSVSQKALAAPRVQELVSLAVRRSHGQFVRLIEDKNEYVATTGGAVTLEYGDLVADLATRLGVDPATIAKLQSVVQEVSTDLKQRLTTTQTRIKSARADLAQVEAGTLSPQLEGDLQTLNTNARRAAGEAREPRQDDRERTGEGPGPAPGQSRQARRSAIGARRSADRSRRPQRRGAEGSQTSERR